ncbi:hypothetical protein, partial [Escherichia coli]|uniref:hypothetical protein n=1 Tax=Escherichia coli TaxID=562 RepID=UPI003075B465
MAHDPNLGFADYFSAADASASSVTTLMPAMDEAAPELIGMQAGMELPSSIQLLRDQKSRRPRELR